MPNVWTLRASDEAASQLRRLVKVWPRVIAAQQSNIVLDVSASADNAIHVPPRRRAVSVPIERLATTDIDRLRAIFRAWNRLELRRQREISDYAALVAGDE